MLLTVSWFASQMAYPGRSFHGIGEVFLLKPECNIYEADKDWHLYKGPDDRCKGLARVDLRVKGPERRLCPGLPRV